MSRWLAAVAALAASCAAAPPPPHATVYVHPFDVCLARCAPYRVIFSAEYEDDGARKTLCRCADHSKITFDSLDAASK